MISSGRSFPIKALGDYGKALLVALKINRGDLALRAYNEEGKIFDTCAEQQDQKNTFSSSSAQTKKTRKI